MTDPFMHGRCRTCQLQIPWRSRPAAASLSHADAQLEYCISGQHAAVMQGAGATGFCRAACCLLCVTTGVGSAVHETDAVPGGLGS